MGAGYGRQGLGVNEAMPPSGVDLRSSPPKVKVTSELFYKQNGKCQYEAFLVAPVLRCDHRADLWLHEMKHEV